VSVTADNFESRVIDNNYVVAYFPNIVMDDATNNRKVVVPASVGALGALGYNDRVAFPWFAPAGFNRAALNFVNLTQVRINQPERDRLTEVKINPIVKFPREGYVIMSQNTLQQAKSALSSINVKRMILEVKRVIVEIGNRTIFDQISTQTRTELVKQFTAVLGGVQSKAGIEMFSIICDDTNNTKEDIESNRMNVQIRLVPTRSIEYIAIDFIVTNSGVQFV
jgi:phage tail sheath protein FI